MHCCRTSPIQLHVSMPRRCLSHRARFRLLHELQNQRPCENCVQIVLDYAAGLDVYAEIRALLDVVHVALASAAPTPAPTPTPTLMPTWLPTKVPTDVPTLRPSTFAPLEPAFATPLLQLQLELSTYPTLLPSLTPTPSPSTQPTLYPTHSPTSAPSIERPMLVISRAPIRARQPCDSSIPPLFGNLGNCSVDLKHGQQCSYDCDEGYTLSGVTSCSNGELTAASCIGSACTITRAPRYGSAGTCGSVLASGQFCQPACEAGFLPSGTSRCTAGNLVAATCERNTTICANPSAPPGCFKGRTCEECCTDAHSADSGACWELSTGATFTACCMACRNLPPNHGTLGPDCKQMLSSRSACFPQCADGYQLKGSNTCMNGRLQVATCTSIDPCAMATFKVRAPSVPSIERSFTATLEMAIPTLRFRAALVITPLSSVSTDLQLVPQTMGTVFQIAGELSQAGSSVAHMFVGEQLCPKHSVDLGTVSCREAYVQSGSRCVRNPKSSVCATSSMRFASSHLVARAVARSTFLLGDSLRVLPRASELPGCQLHLVAINANPSSRSTRASLLFSNVGKFMVHLRCPATTCAFTNFGKLVIGCPPSTHVVGGRCEALKSTCPARTFLLDDGICKRLPELSLLMVSSEELLADVHKNRSSSLASVTVNASLVEGQFEVDWDSWCGSESWVSCSARGRLAPSSGASTARITVWMNASGRVDDSIGLKPSSAEITLKSRVVGPHLVNFPGQHLTLRLQMRVHAERYIVRDDILLTTIENGLWRKLENISLPEAGQAVSIGWGRSLRIQVEAPPPARPNQVRTHDSSCAQVLIVDADGLPIAASPDMYFLRLSGYEQNIAFARVLDCAYGNALAAVIPSGFFSLGSGFRYRLSVVRSRDALPSSTDAEIDITFSTSLVTQLAVAGTIGMGILILLLLLAQMIAKVDREERLAVFKSFVQFEMLLGASGIPLHVCFLPLWFVWIDFLVRALMFPALQV